MKKKLKLYNLKKTKGGYNYDNFFEDFMIIYNNLDINSYKLPRSIKIIIRGQPKSIKLDVYEATKTDKNYTEYPSNLSANEEIIRNKIMLIYENITLSDINKIINYINTSVDIDIKKKYTYLHLIEELQVLCNKKEKEEKKGDTFKPLTFSTPIFINDIYLLEILNNLLDIVQNIYEKDEKDKNIFILFSKELMSENDIIEIIKADKNGVKLLNILEKVNNYITQDLFNLFESKIVHESTEGLPDYNINSIILYMALINHLNKGHRTINPLTLETFQSTGRFFLIEIYNSTIFYYIKTLTTKPDEEGKISLDSFFSKDNYKIFKYLYENNCKNITQHEINNSFTLKYYGDDNYPSPFNNIKILNKYKLDEYILKLMNTGLNNTNPNIDIYMDEDIFYYAYNKLCLDINTLNTNLFYINNDGVKKFSVKYYKMALNNYIKTLNLQKEDYNYIFEIGVETEKKEQELIKEKKTNEEINIELKPLKSTDAELLVEALTANPIKFDVEKYKEVYLNNLPEYELIKKQAKLITQQLINEIFNKSYDIYNKIILDEINKNRDEPKLSFRHYTYEELLKSYNSIIELFEKYKLKLPNINIQFHNKLEEEITLTKFTIPKFEKEQLKSFAVLSNTVIAEQPEVQAPAEPKVPVRPTTPLRPPALVKPSAQSSVPVQSSISAQSEAPVQSSVSVQSSVPAQPPAQPEAPAKPPSRMPIKPVFFKSKTIKGGGNIDYTYEDYKAYFKNINMFLADICYLENSFIYQIFKRDFMYKPLNDELLYIFNEYRKECNSSELNLFLVYYADKYKEIYEQLIEKYDKLNETEKTQLHTSLNEFDMIYNNINKDFDEYRKASYKKSNKKKRKEIEKKAVNIIIGGALTEIQIREFNILIAKLTVDYKIKNLNKTIDETFKISNKYTELNSIIKAKIDKYRKNNGLPPFTYTQIQESIRPTEPSKKSKGLVLSKPKSNFLTILREIKNIKRFEGNYNELLDSILEHRNETLDDSGIITIIGTICRELSDLDKIYDILKKLGLFNDKNISYISNKVLIEYFTNKINKNDFIIDKDIITNITNNKNKYIPIFITIIKENSSTIESLANILLALIKLSYRGRQIRDSTLNEIIQELVSANSEFKDKLTQIFPKYYKELEKIYISFDYSTYSSHDSDNEKFYIINTLLKLIFNINKEIIRKDYIINGKEKGEEFYELFASIDYETVEPWIVERTERLKIIKKELQEQEIKKQLLEAKKAMDIEREKRKEEIKKDKQAISKASELKIMDEFTESDINDAILIIIRLINLYITKIIEEENKSLLPTPIAAQQLPTPIAAQQLPAPIATQISEQQSEQEQEQEQEQEYDDDFETYEDDDFESDEEEEKEESEEEKAKREEKRLREEKEREEKEKLKQILEKKLVLQNQEFAAYLGMLKVKSLGETDITKILEIIKTIINIIFESNKLSIVLSSSRESYTHYDNFLSLLDISKLDALKQEILKIDANTQSEFINRIDNKITEIKQQEQSFEEGYTKYSQISKKVNTQLDLEMPIPTNYREEIIHIKTQIGALDREILLLKDKKNNIDSQYNRYIRGYDVKRDNEKNRGDVSKLHIETVEKYNKDIREIKEKIKKIERDIKLSYDEIDKLENEIKKNDEKRNTRYTELFQIYKEQEEIKKRDEEIEERKRKEDEEKKRKIEEGKRKDDEERKRAEEEEEVRILLEKNKIIQIAPIVDIIENYKQKNLIIITNSNYNNIINLIIDNLNSGVNSLNQYKNYYDNTRIDKDNIKTTYHEYDYIVSLITQSIPEYILKIILIINTIFTSFNIEYNIKELYPIYKKYLKILNIQTLEYLKYIFIKIDTNETTKKIKQKFIEEIDKEIEEVKKESKGGAKITKRKKKMKGGTITPEKINEILNKRTELESLIFDLLSHLITNIKQKYSESHKNSVKSLTKTNISDIKTQINFYKNNLAELIVVYISFNSYITDTEIINTYRKKNLYTFIVYVCKFYYRYLSKLYNLVSLLQQGIIHKFITTFYNDYINNIKFTDTTGKDMPILKGNIVRLDKFLNNEENKQTLDEFIGNPKP